MKATRGWSDTNTGHFISCLIDVIAACLSVEQVESERNRHGALETVAQKLLPKSAFQFQLLMELSLQIVVDDNGKVIDLPIVGTVTVGRGPDNRLQIEESYVSQQHARIEPGGEGGFVVSDLNSKNGTFVNDRRIYGDSRIGEGDVIRFGLASCRVVSPGSEPEASGGVAISASPVTGSADCFQDEPGFRLPDGFTHRRRKAKKASKTARKVYGAVPRWERSRPGIIRV